MTVRELEEEINGSTQSVGGGTTPNADVTSAGVMPNPTTVDINKIKSETEDIKPAAPKIDFESLLKPMAKEEPKVDNVSPIIPTTTLENNVSPILDVKNDSLEPTSEKPAQEIMGGSGLLAGMTIAETQQPQPSPLPSIPDIKATGLFGETIEPTVNSVLNTEGSSNNMLFANVSPTEVKTEQTANATDDITGTVKTVKDAVETIKTSGKKVEMEEFDFEDFYQIVIRIDK